MEHGGRLAEARIVNQYHSQCETPRVIRGFSCARTASRTGRPAGDLTLLAERKGVDGAPGSVCRKRGISLAKDCFRRMVCEGEAVGWR